MLYTMGTFFLRGKYFRPVNISNGHKESKDCTV